MAASLETRLIDMMYELEEEYRGLLERRQANRRSLNDLIAQDLLDTDKVAAIREVYPERAARGSKQNEGE